MICECHHILSVHADKYRQNKNTEKTLKNQFLIALAAGYSKEERVEKLVRGMAKDLLCSYDDARG